jgi:hypothetical protein
MLLQRLAHRAGKLTAPTIFYDFNWIIKAFNHLLSGYLVVPVHLLIAGWARKTSVTSRQDLLPILFGGIDLLFEGVLRAGFPAPAFA